MVAAATGPARTAISIGDTAARDFLVDEAAVGAFAAVSGDHNPVHFDEAFAATTPFKGRIAHGMLLASYFSTVLASDLPGPGAVYLSQSLKFLRPVRLGQTVTVTVTVTEIEPRHGKVTLSTACIAEGKAVVEGEATVLTPLAKAPRRGAA